MCVCGRPTLPYLCVCVVGPLSPTILTVCVLCVCTGGLGEAVAGALSLESGVVVKRLFVTGIPRSGPGAKLMEIYGISASHIVTAVKSLI